MTATFVLDKFAVARRLFILPSETLLWNLILLLLSQSRYRKDGGVWLALTLK
ncbi:hypothetical protein [Prevotella jejuni]|uniref:hypothetical protein n=1 Tax=Prevotella jejuni TaxID=1177574 RepID=UPI0032119CF4